MRRSKIAIGALLSLSAWTTLQACGGDERFSVDEDRDGWPRELDCDDDDPEIFPSADDIPGDGIDQDCSGEDADDRGMGGVPSSGGFAGAQNGSGSAKGSGGANGPEGAGGIDSGGPDQDGDGVAVPVDCDDDAPQVHPGAFDQPWDGIDQDCSGSDSHDRDGDGFDGGPEGTDCDDTRSEVFPGAVEIINNRVDENCDGSDLLTEPTIPVELAEGAIVVGAPDVALVDAEGADELLIVWIDERRGDPRDVMLQRLSLDGSRIGPEINLSESDPEPKSEVHITPGSDGFLVTWMTPEGGWARQVGLTGSPTGIALGITEPGATGFRTAFGGAELSGGGTWGFVWLRPIPEPETDPEPQASFRAMTTDEVRTEIVSLGENDDQILHVSIAGTEEGFLPLWEGDFENTRGIVAQHLDRLGESVEEPWLMREGIVGEPTVVPVEPGYALVFRDSDNLGHLSGVFLDADFALAGNEPSRLSGDSALQFGFRLVATGNQVVALWNDGRHLLDAPAVEAVYGQHFTRDEDRIARLWGPDRAIFAGVGGELGGAVIANDELLVAIRIGTKLGLMARSVAQ